MTPRQGGKSKSSRAEAAVVTTTKIPALVTNFGRYDFGREGNRWMNDNDRGNEYNVQRTLFVRPRARLKAIL